MVNMDSFLPNTSQKKEKRLLNVDKMRERELLQRENLPALLEKYAKEREAAFLKKSNEEWALLIPRRWKKAKLDDFETSIRNKCLSLIEGIENKNPLSSMFIWSPTTGNGKTFLVYAILNALQEKGIATAKNVGLYTEKDVAGIAMSGFDRNDKLMMMLEKKKFIFIDDFSGRSQYGWSQTSDTNRKGVWFDILDYAYSNGISIFITSNKSIYEMKLLLGEEAFDRLQHLTGNGDNVLFLDRNSVRKDIGDRLKKHYGGKHNES